MAGPFDFTGQNIENTYQRVLQTDGTFVYDGTGSLVNINISGSPSIDTGSFVTTSSFNSFTSSIQSQVDSLTNATSSYILNSQTSSMSVLSSSFALTASYVPNALITASVTSNVITFTKGDTSQFSITVDTGSGGGTINTSSFATTGSNIFIGNQTITGSISVTNSVTASYFVGIIDGGTF
jgi:hypothetical protein